MVTTNSPSASESEKELLHGEVLPPLARPEVAAAADGHAPHQPQEPPGFFGLLVKSVFEPGANPAVVLAMNLSFFFLLLTLVGLAWMTDWNLHVLMLIGVNLGLWVAMTWFIMELTKVQVNPENMPIADPLLAETETATTDTDRAPAETRKDR